MALSGMSKTPPRFAASIALGAAPKKRPQRGGGLRPVKVGGVYQVQVNSAGPE
jgi:hypothetical protein